MAKVVSYKVQGTLDTKPEGLPEGLTITEVVVDVPLRETFNSLYGTTFRVSSYHDGFAGDRLLLETVGSSLNLNKLFDKENVKKLRDALNEFLNEKFSPRKVRDNDGSLYNSWYEVAPGKFNYCNSIESAQATFSRHPGDTHSLDKIRANYGIKSIELIEE